MFHRHRYPLMWETISADTQGRGLVLQEKVCATCGKIKRVVRRPSY